MSERFEKPLIAGPNASRVQGPEVEFDARTARELQERLDEIKRRQWSAPGDRSKP